MSLSFLYIMCNDRHNHAHYLKSHFRMHYYIIYFIIFGIIFYKWFMFGFFCGFPAWIPFLTGHCNNQSLICQFLNYCSVTLYALDSMMTCQATNQTWDDFYYSSHALCCLRHPDGKVITNGLPWCQIMLVWQLS